MTFVYICIYFVLVDVPDLPKASQRGVCCSVLHVETTKGRLPQHRLKISGILGLGTLKQPKTFAVNAMMIWEELCIKQYANSHQQHILCGGVLSNAQHRNNVGVVDPPAQCDLD